VWLELFANGKLSRGVSVLYPPIPQWVPYVAGGETPTQLKSAKNLIFPSMKNPLSTGMDNPG